MRIQTTLFALALCPVLASASQTDTYGKDKPADAATMVQKHDPCFVHKGSELLGSNVKNPQGEDLGDIKDLVINPESGEIEYAVLSFGGFLGMGDKLFAVPWDVLEIDEANHSFILDVPKERLENAEGFSKDNWPDMADQGFRSRVYSHYGARPYWN